MLKRPPPTMVALCLSSLAAGVVLVSSCGGDSAGGSSSGSAGSSSSSPQRAAPNAQMQAVLDQHEKLGAKPITSLKPAEARKQPTPADAAQAVLRARGGSLPDMDVKTEDRQISGADGKLPARVYTPEGTAPFPVVLYFHGGGFVIADKDTYDASARALAKSAGCVVVSVDYREAPEHRFPAAHDDAFAAYRWLVDNAQAVQGDPKRIAVAGESAGANLAANVSIAARDQGVAMPVHELLVYPIAGAAMDTPSYAQYADAKPLSKPLMEWFTTYAFDSPAQAKDPRIDLVAAKLEGLPATTVILAQIDPLRSEGEELAKKLKAAGVETEVKVYDGVTHEFFGMGAVVDQAKDAVQFASARLKQAFR